MLTIIDNVFPWFGDMTELGGDILLAILLLALVIGALVVERVAFLRWIYPDQKFQAKILWEERAERSSWYALQFRSLLISRLSRNLLRTVDLTRTLIKLCPLLGLLGTVVGMLEVFDAVAATGANSPRATASGVSKATVTTMAGMVVAIAGMLAISIVDQQLKTERARLNDFLGFDAR